MAKVVANKVFWIFHDGKDVVHIKRNVLVIVSTIAFVAEKNHTPGSAVQDLKPISSMSERTWSQ